MCTSTKTELTLKCTLEIPNGYEAVELRRASTSDVWLSQDERHCLVRTNLASNIPVVILKKLAWKPALRETYYFVTRQGLVDSTTYENQIYDRECIELGNAFKTKIQATEASNRVNAVLQQYQKELANV